LLACSAGLWHGGSSVSISQARPPEPRPPNSAPLPCRIHLIDAIMWALAPGKSFNAGLRPGIHSLLWPSSAIHPPLWAFARRYRQASPKPPMREQATCRMLKVTGDWPRRLVSGSKAAQNRPNRGRHLGRPATLGLICSGSCKFHEKRTTNSCPFGTPGGPGEHQHAKHKHQDAVFLVHGVCVFFFFCGLQLLSPILSTYSICTFRVGSESAYHSYKSTSAYQNTIPSPNRPASYGAQKFLPVKLRYLKKGFTIMGAIVGTKECLRQKPQRQFT
jgi:hypothetical protein